MQRHSHQQQHFSSSNIPPFTPPFHSSVGSAVATPAQLSATPQHPLAEDSFTSRADSAANPAAATPAIATTGATQPSPASSYVVREAGTGSQETVLPSADDAQLHAQISRLRVALDRKAATVGSLEQQLGELQRQLVACDVERRELQLQALEQQQQPRTLAVQPLPSSPGNASPSARLLAQLREELGREVHGAAEARTECDSLRLQVAALQSQLEAAAQVDAQERERLALEAAQSRLLCRARGRQLEQLQAQLQEVTAARSTMDEAAAARVQQAEAEAASARDEAQQAHARATAAESAAAEAQRAMAVAQQAANHAEDRLAPLQADIAELRQHADWQAQRMEELQHSSTGQLIRKYDLELQQLRQDFEGERRQLQTDLAMARAGGAAISSPAVQEAPQPEAVAGNWNDLFDDVDSPSAGAHAGPELGDAAVQTEAEGGEAGCADGKTQAMKEMEAELSRLQEAHAALHTKLSLAQQQLTLALAAQQHMVGPTERDAAIEQAVATERAMAAEAAQRMEAAWRERLGMLERQLCHHLAEVQALRAANEKLEQAVGTVKAELRAASASQDELDRLRHAQARLEKEASNARQEAHQLHQQLKELQDGLQGKKELLAKELQRKEQSLAELAAAAAEGELQHRREVQRLEQQLHHGQAALASMTEELHSLLARQQVALCDSGVQACDLAAAHDAVTQTEQAAAPTSPAPMRARELQQELARVCITPSRLALPRPSLPARAPSSSSLWEAPLSESPRCGTWQGVNGEEFRSSSTAEILMSPGRSAAAASAEDEACGLLLGRTPASSTWRDTPRPSELEPVLAAPCLADISAHPTFEQEVDAGVKPAANPGHHCEAGLGVNLGSLRGPSTLSQSSIGDSPLQRLLASPTCSSLGTLTRSSTALSGFLSPPAASPAPFASASKATASAYSGLRHKQSTSNNLLADIKNLKRELEGSPCASSVTTRRSSYNGSVWGEASTTRSSTGGSSMHSLDASLQRLARLTEGLSRSRLA
ncbi:hypothetical protein N2152v2_005800 [Parachlorella kessleri]